MQDLDNYLDIAPRMQIIHLSDHASGVVYWKPAGLRLYEALRSYIRNIHQEFNYDEVKSPALAGIRLFEQSGHLEKYRAHMFFPNQVDNENLDLMGYALRPMSCPNHIVLYQSQLRSYRELPVAFFEFGEVFRNEPSGSLQVLFRQRQFCQDDSHVFVAKDGVAQGVANYLRMAHRVYKELGFQDLSVALSLRPVQRFGDDAQWDKAEEALRQACRDAKVSWIEQPNDGAFYGPKLELGVKDKRGRVWQMGVIQLDYVLPERFNLEYVNAESQKECPVLLHHAVLGSLERMIGSLLEVHGEHLPEMLHPYPCVVLPISDVKHADYAKAVQKSLQRHYAWVGLDIQADPLGAKIRRWKLLGCSKLVIVGDKEIAQYQNPDDYVASLQQHE